jgi:general secretion pathway protein L
MATRVVGFDLGAYSVKAVIVNPGFRAASVLEVVEVPVPPGDEPHEVRAARAVGQIVREHNLKPDTPYAAISGNQVFIHILEFGFRTAKRADLESAVGGELEGILPVDLEEMVYAFDNLPPDVVAQPAVAVVGAQPGEEDLAFTSTETSVVRGRVAPPATGMRVLACATRKDRARRLLELLDAVDAEPRGLVAAPASYPRVAERIAAAQGKGAPVAIVDIGHVCTDVCILREGRAIFARTLARGGKQVTDAVARVWRLTPAEAETTKHQSGFIASALEPAPSEAWQNVSNVVRPVLEPLARDLRQTLSACRAKTGATPDRMVIVGGGSRLRGMAAFLTEELHIPVSTLTEDDAAAIFGSAAVADPVGADVACLAAGVAFEGATGRPSFDLRQGELAYKADLSWLRAKAVPLAASALAIVALAAVSSYAALYKLRKAEAVLSQRLAVETTEVFGQALSASDTLDRVQPGLGAEQSPLPKMTAYDLLLDINARLPPREEVKVDISELEIKPAKVVIKGTAGSTEKNDAVSTIDLIEKKLKEQKCFEEISPGNISAAAEEGGKNFSFTITAKCM